MKPVSRHSERKSFDEILDCEKAVLKERDFFLFKLSSMVKFSNKLKLKQTLKKPP